MFGAAAIGTMAADPAFAAKLIHPKAAAPKTKPVHKSLKSGKLSHRNAMASMPSGGFAEPADPPPLVAAQPGARERFVRLVNGHTDESIEAVYWRDGVYLPDTMHQLNRVLRDHVSGEVHPIDPRLIDLLGDLRQSVGSSEPFQVISGYRSPRTNAWMHRHNRGVAAHSLHMRGQAADIILADSDLGSLHNAALELGEGGVGYYPRSGFVHVDTGAVRVWDYE
jgi:uncharacterized protein YcbK (DUF882 family)